MSKNFLIVGLGNPDSQYFTTRHNVGFMFLDWLAKKFQAPNFNLDPKTQALITRATLGKNKIILAKSQNYVNQSGLAVKKIKMAYRLKNQDILIVHDDLDLLFGSTKLTPESGDGGHRGVKSIHQQLKTEKIYRLKIGVANSQLKKARAQRSDQKRKEAVTKIVLSSFTPNEKKQLNAVFKEGLDKASQLF